MSIFQSVLGGFYDLAQLVFIGLLVLIAIEWTWTNIEETLTNRRKRRR